MHYSKVAGSVQQDCSSIGLILAKTQPEKLVRTCDISNSWFLIPPGADNHRVTACWMAKGDIHIIYGEHGGAGEQWKLSLCVPRVPRGFF